MIEFHAENDFVLPNPEAVQQWIAGIIATEEHSLGELVYVFCDDDYLHRINLEFLGHDTYTDIISFDYSLGKQVNGEIYISVERVRENAQTYKTHFQNELLRVIIHGALHLLGYKDKTKAEESQMREKEEEALASFKS